MVAGPFLFAFQIGDGPITDASRGFDFFAGIWNRSSASRVISAGVRLQFRIGRVRSCSAERFVLRTQSWMNFKTAAAPPSASSILILRACNRRLEHGIGRIAAWPPRLATNFSSHYQKSVLRRAGQHLNNYIERVAPRGGAQCPMLKTSSNVPACLKSAPSGHLIQFPASITGKWRPTTDL